MFDPVARVANTTAASRVGKNSVRRKAAPPMKSPLFRAVQLTTLVDTVPTGRVLAARK